MFDVAAANNIGKYHADKDKGGNRTPEPMRKCLFRGLHFIIMLQFISNVMKQTRQGGRET
jgi:hypothetical protein